MKTDHNIRKVLLISPPYYKLFDIDQPQIMPLGPLYIASVLRNNGYSVRVYNPDLSTTRFPRGMYLHPTQFDYDKYKDALNNPNHYVWLNLKRVLNDYKPDIVGISIMSFTYDSAKKVAEIVKNFKNDCIIVIGGAHPTIFTKETLLQENFDIAVRGEGEYTMLDLLDTINSNEDLSSVRGVSFKENGSIINNQNRELIKDLDCIPFPARDLLIQEEFYPTVSFGRIITGRGCPFSCKYCAVNLVWRRSVRLRSPENVIDEMEQIYRLYNPIEFNFDDDTFNVSEERVEKICDLIRERNIKTRWNCMLRLDNVSSNLLERMKAAGCARVTFGIESGDQDILNRMNKKINLEQIRNAVKITKSVGINIWAHYIIGYPGETPESLRNTINLINELDTEFVVQRFMPFPGTEVYNELKDEGKILANGWDDYNLVGCKDWKDKNADDKEVFYIESIDKNILVREYKNLRKHSKCIVA